MEWDFDAMREIVKHAPGSPRIKRVRLNLFDIYRYCEEYDKLWKMVEDLKGEQRQCRYFIMVM